MGLSSKPYSFVLCILLHCILGVNSQRAPTLTVTYLDRSWKNLSRSEMSADTKAGFYHSGDGNDLSFACEAKYPIHWNFKGLILPREIVKIQPPIRILAQNTYQIIVHMYFLDATDHPNSSFSFRLSCENVYEPLQKEEILVFARGNSRQTLVPPKITTVENSDLIPCPTTNVAKKVSLYRRLQNGKEEIERDTSIQYFPIEGFRKNGIFRGSFICRQESSSVAITARQTESGENDEFLFSPKTDQVTLFSDELIRLECASRSGRFVEINFYPVTTGEKFHINRVGKGGGVILEATPRNQSEEGIRGSVSCTAPGLSRPIKIWNLEVVPSATLFLDNFEGEVDCLSVATPTQMNTVRCKSFMECNFMSACFENDELCNFKKQKQFYASKNTTCFVQSDLQCLAVPYAHLNGIAQCKIDGLARQWQYFVSLNNLKYSNWIDAPTNEIVYMEERPSVLYTNGTTQFVCKAVAYLFADSISFEIQFKNGSRRLLHDEDSVLRVKITNPEREDRRRIDEFNFIGILDISLPLEAVAINCLAPFGNSSDVLTVSREFETRHLIRPQFNETIRGGLGVQHERFFTGDKNRRLVCPAFGEPRPKYKWMYNMAPLNESFNDFKTSVGSNGEGYLEFPDITGDKKGKQYSGHYQCVAESEYGYATRSFNLKIEDEPISGRTVIYIVIVVLILLVLVFVLFMLYVFFRKYQEAQALVRSLTDLEIKEFFDGKPELISGENNFEMIDFLPYKSEYEIPLDDLELDTSESNFLGSGEFAYVVRGKVVSKQQPVAVKISKPTADITVFKSLLSEVKIMIYIGTHQNVVKLLGVCTSGIRTRSIHIATEICDLGSLDTYLRKSRPNFENLINANQEIDCNLLSESQGEKDVTVSTLDLINFSAQIANGMEYLASKCVVHADLATRNVLLTKAKVVKISDFGLSKKLYECNNYVKKTKSPLPWRWMALESLNTLSFSTRSDIWAYGVTSFEIFTLGDIPFPNEEWNKEFIIRLSSGMRMGRPKYSTQEIYSKIMVCWENEPELRPDFPSLREFFTQLLKKYGNLKDKEDGGDSKQSRNGNGGNQNATAIAVAMAKEFSTKKSNSNGGIQKPKRQYMNVPIQNSGESIELSETHHQEPIYANF